MKYAFILIPFLIFLSCTENEDTPPNSVIIIVGDLG